MRAYFIAKETLIENWSPLGAPHGAGRPRLYLNFKLRSLLPILLVAVANAQVAPATSPASAAPVPYSSVSELNLLLSQLEQISQTLQLDLAKLRIEKWKTDANTKHGSQADVDSIQRNLQNALPEMVGQLRNSPENLAATFKLYRNLDALYDVFASVVESSGAFGSRDEFQSLQNDFNALERSRHSVADRMETLTNTKEGELAKLRTELQNAQAAAAAAPPVKKVIVDDTEPVKKPPSKKSKTAKKPPSTPAPQPNPASGGQPAQPGPPQSQ
ncbi:MAG: hypothetical protein WB952_21440 [Terriglobales bacterium]